MEKKEEIYQFIHEDTLNKLKSENYDALGLNALDISDKLQTDRSNVSRLLNQLFNDGRLIKTSSRPVIFIDRSALIDSFGDIAIPSIISTNYSIKDYLNNNATLNSTQTDFINSFHRYIDNPRQSKMYEPIAKAKAALHYPNGLNTLIFGEKGSGRLQFAKSMASYAKEAKIIDSSEKINIIECLNYNIQNEDTLLKMLFGEYNSKNESYKRGIFQIYHDKIIILNNIDCLPERVSGPIFNAILDKSFSPINSSKRFSLSSFIIATSTTNNILSNTDIRKCFPMQIDIPNLYNRTIIEKLAIILQYFQDEAINTNKTIRISKDALSCFVMSEYKGNLAELRAEIKQSCALGYAKYVMNEGFFINIGFDEISTPVLTNITNVNERLAELHDTLNLFDNEFIFFSANQPNQELQLIFSLSKSNNSEEIKSIKKVDEEIINQCIMDIDSASSIQLNSIRSILLQKIYDIVYPLLNGHPITSNENLIYGLLLHISNEINHITSGKDTSSLSPLSAKIARNLDYDYTKKITDTIESYYSIKLNKIESDYIATYLYLSSQWIDKKYIQILLVSKDNETAKKYAEYINSQYFKTHAHYLFLNEPDNIDIISEKIEKKIREIDKGKGVILVLDHPESKQINNILNNTCNNSFIMIKKMDVQNLISIAQKVESLGTTLNTVTSFNKIEIDNTPQTAPKEFEEHSRKLLKDIQEKLLAESLVFLNPDKACQALYNVLLNILADLGIPYNDDLLIKFLFHTTFTIERCIRKEPYNYPKSRTLIKKHENLFNILEKNFKVINEIFSIQIPLNEMSYIIEIFLPYIE